MEAPVGIGILKQAVFALIIHTHLLVFCFLRAHEIVSINKVISGVVGWVNVDHLDLAQIALLQELEDFQIVALDVEVFGSIPVFAFFRTGAQRLADGLIGLHNGSLLAYPCKLIGFVALYHIRREHLPQQIKIDGFFRLAVLVHRFCNTVGEQCADLLNILRR